LSHQNTKFNDIRSSSQVFSLFTSLYNQNSPHPITLPSVPKALRCFQPTFTRRTSGHSPGIFTAENVVSLFLPPTSTSNVVSLTTFLHLLPLLLLLPPLLLPLLPVLPVLPLPPLLPLPLLPFLLLPPLLLPLLLLLLLLLCASKL